MTTGFASAMFGPASAGERQFAGATSPADVAARLQRLAEIGGKNSVCYVYGAGGQPRALYRSLRGRDGIEVIFDDDGLPRRNASFGQIVFLPTLWLLTRVIPARRGLVRIDDRALLPTVFESLIENNTAAVFLFDRHLESEFISRVRGCDGHSDWRFGIQSDPAFLVYLVDGDSHESESGFTEAAAIGPECRQHLFDD